MQTILELRNFHYSGKDVNEHLCVLQAVSVVSGLVSRGRFDELQGLVTSEVCMCCQF